MKFLRPDWQLPHVQVLTTLKDSGYNFAFDNNKRNIELNKFVKELNLIQQPYFLKQVHGNTIHIINEYSDTILEGDALLTSSYNLPIGVLTADCLPVVIAHRKKPIVSVIHAGWRGIINEIIPLTIEKMLGFCSVKDLFVWFAPCISADKFEVQEDVYLQFKKTFLSCFNKISMQNSSSYFIDLQMAAFYQCVAQGVSIQQIYTNKYCTLTNEKLFYSYRNKDAARMATIAYIPKDGNTIS